MDVPVLQTMARELELMSGFRRSHVYITGDFDHTTTVRIGVIDAAQPTSLLIRDLANPTALVGSHLCYRDSETKAPRRARVLSAAAAGAGGFTLTLDQAITPLDGDDACIEWPE
jgi:hypothetical protein